MHSGTVVLVIPIGKYHVILQGRDATCLFGHLAAEKKAEVAAAAAVRVLAADPGHSTASNNRHKLRPVCEVKTTAM